MVIKYESPNKALKYWIFKYKNVRYKYFTNSLLSYKNIYQENTRYIFELSPKSN